MNSPACITSPKLGSIVVAIAAALALTAAPLHGSTPSTGTLDPTSANAVTWTGDATGTGAANGESTCFDGVNCDVFTLTLTGDPTDYTGKQLKIAIDWTVPTDDYDVYVHKDTLTGAVVASSAGGAPSTEEAVTINPATSGTGKYVIHVVYFTTVPADQYTGSAKFASTSTGPALRTATYVNTGITFSPNIPLKAPVTTRDGEPSNRTDFAGNAYVGGIRGFPAGVDLWRFDLNPASPTYDPFMRVPIYRGQPDAFSPTTTIGDLGGDGGGDIDLAVAFSLPAGQQYPTLAFSSLIAANVSTGNSTDRGFSFQKNPLGNSTGGVSADDRQWEEFLGSTTVYLYYRTLDPAVTQIQRSTDGGVTFGPAQTAGTTTQVGPIDVHQATGVVYAGTSQGTVNVGIPAAPGAEPTVYNTYQAATDSNGVAHLFFVTKVADDGTPNGTVYVCYSNDHDILLKHSTDQGKTWSPAVKVNNPADSNTLTNVFPWMETGPLPGSVGIVWYGTPDSKNDDAAEWKVYFAQSLDASSATPTFRIAEVTEPEHIIHASNISEGGLTGAANRNLIDYFQVSFDPNGAAVIAYTDDHNDYDGHTYVAHQISGPSIKTGNDLPAPVESSSLVLPDATSTVDAADVFPPRVPGLNGEQVTDYAQDLQESSVARVRANDPSDVLSVRYDTSGTGSSLAIAGSMKVSDLSVIPGQTTWQMSFAVNAPHSVLSPTGTYSFGATDHADQFFLEADTNVDGSMTYSYGTVKRESDGKLTYTKVGNADVGEFNQADNTISVQVSVAKLNAVLTGAKHTLITDGTTVSGLRGRSYTVEVVPPVSGQASRQGRRDIARGGTQFSVHDSAFPYPTAPPAPTPLPTPGAGYPSPTPPNINLANISTRVAVGTGEKVGVAGFIVRRTAPKRLLIRARGPSLPIDGALQDPVLEIRDASDTVVATSDNWRSAQQAEITSTGLAPSDDREAAVILNLTGAAASNNYTAKLTGKAGTGGIGLVEVYDINAESYADLGNLSTRGFVGVDAEVLIGGLIVRDSSGRNASQDILVRGIGPTLANFGVISPLADPAIDLKDANGNLIETNDDWAANGDPDSVGATGAAPKNPKEAAIRKTLAPGAYTVILRGGDGGQGVGIVEAYNLGNQ